MSDEAARPATYTEQQAIHDIQAMLPNGEHSHADVIGHIFTVAAKMLVTQHEMICERDARLSAAAEREAKLREIVSKLPTTADGVTVTPGMVVFAVKDGHIDLSFSAYNFGSAYCYFDELYYPWCDIYSTEAAAAAALATERKAP